MAAAIVVSPWKSLILSAFIMLYIAAASMAEGRILHIDTQQQQLHHHHHHRQTSFKQLENGLISEDGEGGLFDMDYTPTRKKQPIHN